MNSQLRILTLNIAHGRGLSTYQGFHGARGIKRNDVVWIESRRGKVKAVVETQGRNRPAKGYTFAAFFDEGVFVNKVCLDVTCPMSKEEDFKKAAVKIYKA